MSGRMFDAFTFFNELDLLEIRLEELDPVVDGFVIAEAPVTFQGAPKPLHFADNRDRFARFLPKITHLVVDDMPGGDDPWMRERHQRNALRRGLADLAPHDRAVVSDLDEIPRRAAVARMREVQRFAYLETPLFIYYLNWAGRDWPGPPWTRAYVLTGEALAALPDLNDPREKTPAQFLGEAEAGRAILADAGWHFSYLGGAAGMMAKLGAYSHSEPEVQRWREVESLEREVRARRHFVNGAALTPVPVDASFPAFVQANQAVLRERGLLR